MNDVSVANVPLWMKRALNDEWTRMTPSSKSRTPELMHKLELELRMPAGRWLGMKHKVSVWVVDGLSLAAAVR